MPDDEQPKALGVALEFPTGVKLTEDEYRALGTALFGKSAIDLHVETVLRKERDDARTASDGLSAQMMRLQELVLRYERDLGERDAELVKLRSELEAARADRDQARRDLCRAAEALEYVRG